MRDKELKPDDENETPAAGRKDRPARFAAVGISTTEKDDVRTSNLAIKEKSSALRPFSPPATIIKPSCPAKAKFLRRLQASIVN
jgi:hypothetical protein